MPESAHDVVVVGAGVAGLSCARELARLGLDVVLLEAAERVGGRVTSDDVDGFVVDRGFQVLNPAYPNLRKVVPMGRLGLRSFPRQVRVRTGDRLVELNDPSRRPGRLPAALASGLVRPGDFALLAAVARSVVRDRPRGENFESSGFTGPLRRQVIDPFLAGVLCERDQSTSARFVSWLLAMFAVGTPGLPSGGMRTLPRLMAEGLDVRLGTTVEHVDLETGTLATSAGEFAGRHVVVAAGPTATAQLAGGPVPEVNATCTFWFATTKSPSDTAAIHLDGSGEAPVATTTVVSNLAPEYAPAGQHLVAALALADAPGSDPREVDEGAVRSQLAHIYQTDTAAWRLVARHDLAETVPAVAPGRHRSTAGIERRGRALVCGDQFGNASLDGAAASGLKAAAAIVRRG